MPAAMDAADAALIEDWNRHLDNLSETDLAAYHLTNNYFRFSEEQWRRLTKLQLVLYIVLFAIASVASVLVIFRVLA